MKQDSLFGDPKPIAIEKPRDPVEQKRLNKQCYKILERLVAGPMANHEMSTIALSYTRRISDPREHGFTVVVSSRDYKTAVTMYALLTAEIEYAKEVLKLGYEQDQSV